MLTARAETVAEPGSQARSARKSCSGRHSTRLPLPLKLLLVVVAMLAGFILRPVPVSGATNGREVQVLLTDGTRLHVSRIDLQPTSHTVILESSTPGLTISRRLPVSRVHSVTVAGRTVVFPAGTTATVSSAAAADSADNPELQLLPVSVDDASLAPAPREVLQPVESFRQGIPPATADVPAPADSSYVPSAVSPVRSWRQAGIIVSTPAGWHVPAMASAGLFRGPGVCGDSGSPGRLIGVRPGPLAAYADLIAAYFPFGVPASEAGAVLPLLRAARAAQMLSRPVVPVAAVPPAPSVPFAAPLPPSPLVPPAHLPGAEMRPFPPANLPATRGPVPGWEGGAARFDLPPDSASLQAAARPVSLQGQSDLDSLTVEIQLVDTEGRLLPFEGTLKMRLNGIEVRAVPGFGPVLQAEPVREQLLATRSVAVRAGANRPALLASLPLPRRPEVNSSLAPVGDLELELVVPGRGIFATVLRDIPLAGRSQLENWRLLTTGQRFSSGQPVEAPRMQAGALYRRLRKTSSLGPAGRVFAIQP